jgi:FkbM family methyltransferase
MFKKRFLHPSHRPDLEIIDNQAADALFAEDMKRLLTPQSLVLDVGANRGQFALNLLKFADVSKIYCFEPVPQAYLELEKLAQRDPRVIPKQMAISSVTSKVPFFVTKSDVGSSLLRPVGGQPSQWLTLEEEIQVDSIRLDDFINREFGGTPPFIDLLKSDAQGADAGVLESAGSELFPKRIRAVLVEVNFSNFYTGQDSYIQILSLLDIRGYRPARIYSRRAHDNWLWWADVLFIAK